jgi:hypothetical protein
MTVSSAPTNMSTRPEIFIARFGRLVRIPGWNRDHDHEDHTAPRRPKAPVDDVDPPPRSVSTIVAAGDFSLGWLTEQRAELVAEHQALTGRKSDSKSEANALLDAGETADVRFDDEGVEGDGMAVERDRDLMLSAQARETIAEIDAALGHAPRRGEARDHRKLVTTSPAPSHRGRPAESVHGHPGRRRSDRFERTSANS